jgi:hypothetical protein
MDSSVIHRRKHSQKGTNDTQRNTMTNTEIRSPLLFTTCITCALYASVFAVLLHCFSLSLPALLLYIALCVCSVCARCDCTHYSKSLCSYYHSCFYAAAAGSGSATVGTKPVSSITLAHLPHSVECLATVHTLLQWNQHLLCSSSTEFCRLTQVSTSC